ncbi:MAG: YolD-like family protein [Tuberibacillus sp.]
MVFDRGSIKWASLMLPEHVKALREWRDDEKHPKAKTPEYDEQTHEIFDHILQEAFQNRRPLSITFIKDGEPSTVSGLITKLDALNGRVTLGGCGQNEAKQHIPIHHIIKME